MPALASRQTFVAQCLDVVWFGNLLRSTLLGNDKRKKNKERLETGQRKTASRSYTHPSVSGTPLFMDGASDEAHDSSLVAPEDGRDAAVVGTDFQYTLVPLELDKYNFHIWGWTWSLAYAVFAL